MSFLQRIANENRQNYMNVPVVIREMEKLIQKREELHSKELMDVFFKSDRTYDEIMEFLKSGEIEP